MDDILMSIRQERARQDYKWGDQDHLPIVWLLILSEEIGEAAKSLNEWFFHRKPGSFEETRAELIQSAAVIVAMIESMDRNRGRYDE